MNDVKKVVPTLPENVKQCFVALQRILNTPIPDNRSAARIRSRAAVDAIHMLERHGITDAVVRFGFTSDVTVPLLLAVLNVEAKRYPAPLLAQWAELMHAESMLRAKGSPAFIGMFSDNMERLTAWAQTAPIGDLITAKPLSRQDWDNLRLIPLEDKNIVDSYCWLHDRYLNPDIWQWTTASLHKEYLFRRQSDTGAFPASAVTPVTIDDRELDAVIAERAVFGSNETRSHLYQQVYRSAHRLLMQDDYEAAATLFRFFLGQNPSDPEGLNSLGFCLIPRDPEQAERYLRQSLDYGFHLRSLTWYNLCCCMLLRGEPERMLQEVRHYWCEERTRRDRESDGALIWKVNDDSTCILCDASRIDECLIALCVAQSERLGDDSIDYWRQEMDKLQHVSQ